jgi:hypothetical protein
MKQLYTLTNALEEFIHHVEVTKDESSPEYLVKFIGNLKDLKTLCVSMKQFKVNMSDDLTEEEIEKAIKPIFDKYLDTLK